MAVKKLIPFLFVWLGMTTPVHALTFVQMPDQALLNQSALVLEGEIIGTVPFVRQPRDYTVYRVDVTRYLKGDGYTDVEVRVPGSIGSDHDGINDALVIPGMPRFKTGDQVLLFLNPRGDGTYAITQSALGVFFKQTMPSGDASARRNLSGSFELPGTGLGVLLPAADQLRDWQGFAQWLQAAAAGGNPAPTYWNATQPGDEPVTANFTTLQGPGENPARWFQFDSGQNVTFRAHSSGQPGLPGGGFSQFQAGIAAWDNDAGSNIRYLYGGTTTATGGLCSADGINAIIFTDAGQAIACDLDGTYDCDLGGVIATGGYRSNGTGTFNGTLFNRITESDIVVNGNAGCFLAENGGSNASEVYAHELGHTLGLGHSCGDSGIGLGVSDCTLNASANDALMRANPHADGRGADLRADDEAGAAFLYGASSGGGGGGGGGGGAPPAASSGGGGGGGAIDPILLALCLLLAGVGVRARRLAVPVGRKS